MKKVSILSLAFLVAAIVTGCGDDPTGTNLEDISSEKQFVYNSMNYWYYWQGDVPNLADGRFSNDQELGSFLQGFSDAKELFGALQFSADDFSFFIDDYEEFENEQDGINAALGFNYGFIGFQNSNDIVGYARYIIPNSPADDAGLQRLDLFTKVDGTDLNTSNYKELLSDNSSHTLTLATIEETPQGVTFQDSIQKTIQSEQVIENPIYLSTVIDTNSINVGYMMYNAFQDNSHQDLNDTFADFENQNIDELILDLRYNGGGAVLTSQLLSSMISGLGSSNKFAEFSYNQKRSDQNESVFFFDEVPLQNSQGEFERNNQGEFVNTEPMNDLGLNKVYVLTSGGTASASEALINSLSPYIDVTIIGTQTVGKDEGSLTLYDAPEPYLDKDEANPDHKKAIQPIVLKIVNSEDDDYPNGFTPSSSNNVPELTAENLQNKPAIGSPDDPLLARAVELITGQPIAKDADYSSDRVVGKLMPQNKLGRPNGNGMYLLPEQANFLFGN